MSKVANFSIDLPDAAVAIQVSGTFGSRQEEAQRLGRILRPKADGGQAHFYAVVARDTATRSSPPTASGSSPSRATPTDRRRRRRPARQHRLRRASGRGGDLVPWAQ